MITIDFGIAAAAAISVVLAGLFGVWLLFRPQQKKEIFLSPGFIWFCSVCTYSYINTREEAISACPRCGSYNRK